VPNKRTPTTQHVATARPNATRPTYSFQGTDSRGTAATNTDRIYHPLHLSGSITAGREGSHVFQALGALVPHPHGSAHTPALTISSLSQSAQARHAVDANGAPVTTLSNEGTVPTVPLPRLTMRDLYARAGLPVPVYPEKPTQTHDNRAWDSKIGTFTHLISGRLAPTAQAMRGQELRAVIGETVGAMVKDRSLGRLDKARLRVTGMVSQYLTHFVPPAPTVFLGTELAAGTGRVDLAWDDPTAGVFFDEIKTWRHVQATLDEDTWTQVHRYLDHGIATYGDRFAGVRVITLSHLRSCIRISPEGLVESLAMSPLHPDVLTRGVAA
jgi:hypothetical protein